MSTGLGAAAALAAAGGTPWDSTGARVSRASSTGFRSRSSSVRKTGRPGRAEVRSRRSGEFRGGGRVRAQASENEAQAERAHEAQDKARNHPAADTTLH
jgi:hypothetical protein